MTIVVVIDSKIISSNNVMNVLLLVGERRRDVAVRRLECRIEWPDERAPPMVSKLKLLTPLTAPGLMRGSTRDVIIVLANILHEPWTAGVNKAKKRAAREMIIDGEAIITSDCWITCKRDLSIVSGHCEAFLEIRPLF